ncbi:MAG TPA: hypothetical protein VHO90_19320 [Bacteroidales bacterium]|nr:hypothetical protein [Bacteroidales bacterium]
MNYKSTRFKSLMLFAFISVLSSSVFAQVPKAKFGKPTIDELKMTVYDKDSGAVAVILYDYGEFSTNDFTFNRHTKIKILKKEGYTWANNSFLAGNEYSLKGFTHNLENGQIVSTKLEKDQIFPEQYGTGRYNVKFTLPNVKEGSVIEYRISYRDLPDTWYFQRSIPVVWSEIYIPESSYFTFSKTTYGYDNIRTLETNHWYAKDVPAVKEEPYVSTLYNFVSKMEFELQNVTIPGYYKSFTDSWDNVNKLLSEDADFGEKLKVTGFMRETVKAIEAQNLPPYQRMKKAYETIQKHMKWNESNYIFSTKLMSAAYKEHSGNTGEINLMLIALLRDLDLKANPIVLSTRDNGILHPANPTIDKLNYVIAHVQIDTTDYVLDATDPFLPAGMLPMRCLNGQGRFFETKNYLGNWYNLSPKTNAASMTFMDLKLNEAGEISGKVNMEKKGYAAHDLREEISELAGPEKYIEDYQTDNKGFKINSYKIDNLDSLYKSVKMSMEVEISDNAVATSDKIFFNPLFADQLSENPFKSEKRTYPVDFGYGRDYAYIMKIEIPQGYSVAELPKSMVLKSPDSSIRYVYSSSTVGNTINVTCKLSIGKTMYLPADYEILRELYNQIVTKEAEQVILKKI